MIRVYHGTNLGNYESILETGLKKYSWVTLEYEDAEIYAFNKLNLDNGIVIAFEIPEEIFDKYFVEKDENWEALSDEHFVTKKILPKEFILEDEDEE